MRLSRRAPERGRAGLPSDDRTGEASARVDTTFRLRTLTRSGFSIPLGLGSIPGSTWERGLAPPPGEHTVRITCTDRVSRSRAPKQCAAHGLADVSARGRLHEPPETARNTCRSRDSVPPGRWQARSVLTRHAPDMPAGRSSLPARLGKLRASPVGASLPRTSQDGRRTHWQ